jgi:hypothetical protein
MERKQLISNTVNYLRNIGVLSGSPVFEKSITDLICVDPRGQWDEYYRQYPYWQPGPVEYHESRFREINSKIASIGREAAQERMLEIVPDSRNTVLIELGSEYGVNGSGYIASKKPKIEVRMVCRSWDGSQQARWLFKEVADRGMRHQVRFKKGQELLKEVDLERRINGLYQENGIQNVRFYHHEVQLQDLDGHTPGFLSGIQGNDIYLLGYLAPARLPFLMGIMYNQKDAKSMLVSMSAQEKIRPDEFPWEMVKKNLGLTDEELQGYVASAHDPIAAAQKGSLSNKYDYRDPGQRRVGMMIKLGMALALAEEVDGEVLKTDCRFHLNNYNKEDYYVAASRR